MTQVSITLDVEKDPNMANSLKAARETGTLIDLSDEPILVEIGGVSKGTKGGNATVLIALPLPDGKKVVAQVTLRLLSTVVELLKIQHPDQY